MTLSFAEHGDRAGADLVLLPDLDHALLGVGRHPLRGRAAALVAVGVGEGADEEPFDKRGASLPGAL